VSGTLRQPVGRFVIDGFFNLGIPCDGTTHTWTANVITEAGRFAGGKASVEAGVFACGLAGCDQDLVQQPVRLVR
jgi:hypothetical protein